IDESEAVSAEECLVTQENIDQLILEDQENPVPEDPIVEQAAEPPLLEAEEPVVEEPVAEEQIIEEDQLPQDEQLPQEESMPQEDIISEQEIPPKEAVTTEQEVGMEEEKNEEIVEEKSESDAIVVDLNEDDDLKGELDNIENDELQGEIDDLLDGSEDEDEDDWEQDSLISQDDIEDLIKSSENEDEDALGDLDDFDSPDDEDSLSDDDPVEDEDEDEEEDEEDDSQVILEELEDQSEDDENIEKPEKKKKKKAKKKKKKRKPIKIKKKFVVIAASILLVIGISLTAGFFFLKGDKNKAPKQKVVARAIPAEEPVVESVDIDVDQKPFKSKMSQPAPIDLMSKPLIMENFMILAPEAIEGLAYIEADITIDYSTNNAYNEIKLNMPFYRDVIYSAIQKALGSSKGDKITESDLIVIIRKALIEALPEGSIKKVGFDSFKAG
ncbi:MAG: hypothetical protein GY707_03050, partial [Desulfobacteraceae bacterium]|nr:hypothetical protein [Desulfobacteraceae bacterium]